MAVTINGDGTIIGVSVGGLPTGSVTADTLATNSVNSAELIDGAVDNSHLATGIDVTKLADGTITNSELQYINSLSSNAQTQINGAGGATVGTPYATTSGTTFTIASGIPSTAKIIFISFNEISGSGVQNLCLRIGDSGGMETSGYKSTGAKIVATTPTITADTIGWRVRTDTAINHNGLATIVLGDSSANTWFFSSITTGNTNQVEWSAGKKSLSGTLTQVGLHLAGGESYDNGSINVTYI
jgi:hypothetical protein